MNKILKCGTKVIIAKNIDGIITAIEIRFDKITYQIGYFYQGEYKSIWIDEQEFSCTGKKQSIGFR